MAPLRRRAFLQAAGALALAGCGPVVSPFERASPPPLPDGLVKDEDDGRFPLGVQASGVEVDDVRLWTFAARSDDDLELWLWRADDDAIVDVARRAVVADGNGFVVATPSGLVAGATYFYAFGTTDGRRRSAVGRFVVAPPDDEERVLRLACASCTTWRKQPWVALQRMAGFDFDLILHMGDMVYADAARDEDAYRASWRRALRDPGYRALLPRAAKLHVWDDHEFWNNPDPESDPERIAIARRAFYENTAMHEGEDGRLWRSHRFGKNAEIILMDARTERRPSTIGGDDVYVSEEQLEFVAQRLLESDARFKIVLNSLPITRMPDAYPGAEDRWQGYRTQRKRLLEVLADDDAARGTLFLSGDFHLGFVGRAEAEGLHRRVVEVACGPSGNTDNPFGAWPLRDLGLPASQFDFVTGRMNATLVELDPATGEARVRFVDGETGETLFDDVVQPGV